MTVATLYAVTLIVFLAVDAVMLTLVMNPLFQRHVGPLMTEEPKLGIAAVFYLFYVAGILWFCSWPALSAEAPMLRAALNGAILGALSYGTYEFVNMSTLRGWSWTMVAADTSWGAVLTALSAVAGVWAVRAFGLVGTGG